MDEWTQDRTLIQGTEAWRGARTRRLGGSEIAVVLRISPYKTRRELWEEKTGRRESPDIGNLPHVMRGTLAEPIARGMLEAKRGVKYATPVLIHPEHPWAVASLDGLTHDHTLEIKTMSRVKHEDAGRGVIPEYYRTQVLWGLMIAGVERGLFASYRPEDGTLHEIWIERDREWETMALAAGAEFMEWVERDVAPPDEAL